MLSPTKPAAGWRLTSIEVPSSLRALVRARESSILFLGAAIGAVAGLIVAGMGGLVTLMHTYLFALPLGQRLSAVSSLDPGYAIGVPLLGGLLFGVSLLALARWRPAREVDPIEANALYGGRMSLTGSIVVAAQTVWSSGVGASVGLEAGYTPLASGFASRIGWLFRLGRRDRRVRGRLGWACVICV